MSKKREHSVQASLRAQPLSRAQLCAAPWAVARQAPLSMGFSRQEHRSGLPCPSPVHMHANKYFKNISE